MDRPFCLIIAGPNGAGKTTLTRSMRSDGIDFGEYINPDDIANEIQGSYDERVSAAQRIADTRRDTCIVEKRSFSFETVMSHPSKIEVLRRAKEAGFITQLFFVGTEDPKTNIERVALRVTLGEHDVPPDKIVSRWHRTMGLLNEAIRSVDTAYIFDNSAAGIVENVPRLVFRRDSLREGKNPVSEQYRPLPRWVEYYVLRPLGISSSGVYISASSNSFQAPSTITFPSQGYRARATLQDRFFQSYPHNLELEQMVLGSLIQDPNSIESFRFIESHHFFEPIHRRIFEGIAEFLKNSHSGAASEWLKKLVTDEKGNFDLNDYVARLSLEGEEFSDADILGAAKEIYDLALRRALMLAADDIASLAERNPNGQTPRGLVKEAERRILDVGETAYYEVGLQPASNAFMLAVEKVAKTFSDSRSSAGLSTGLTDVDRVIGGLRGADLLVVASRPSIGKTSFGTNVAYNVAKTWRGEINSNGELQTEAGGVVAFFSFEMSAEQIAARIIASEAKIPSDRMLDGRVSEAEFSKLADAAIRFNSIPLFIDDASSFSIDQLALRARHLKARRGLDLLVIDNFQILQRATESAYRSSKRKAPRTSAALKELAKELTVPIIVLFQLPSPRNVRDSKPKIGDLDRYLEQDADVIMLLHREDHYWNAFRPPETSPYEFAEWLSEMDRLYGRAELNVSKNRHGPTGVVELLFDAQVSQFSDLQRLS